MWPALRHASRLGLPAGRLRCSFCGRKADAAERLVAGASAHICDTCISKCVAILREHGGFAVPGDADRTEPIR